MQVIYAIGQPRLLEFTVTDRPQTVPAGAIVFAICDGNRRESLTPQLDEDLFAVITDEEYYTYMALLRDAVEGEKKRLRDRPATIMRRFFNWLSATPPARAPGIHQSGG